MRGTAVVLCAALAIIAAGCRSRSTTGDGSLEQSRAAVEHAHEAYVAAINANKADLWLASLANDVVYLVPNRPAVVGKAAVAAWVAAYLDESRTHWAKTVDDFEVSGEWAFGRYTYTVSDNVIIHDPEVEGGGTANDSGWGFIVYHRESDGQWRVSRDGWGSERPAR